MIWSRSAEPAARRRWAALLVGGAVVTALGVDGFAVPRALAADAPAAPPVPVSAPPPAEHGQAEPAPLEPPPPGGPPADSLPRLTRHRLAVLARFAYRLGDAGQTVSPAAGYGAGFTYEYIYAAPGPGIELALGGDFSTDRFATAEKGMANGTTYDSTRVILESAFMLVHTAAVRLGPVRPFFTVAAGLGIGDLESVDQRYEPGTLRNNQFLARVSLGLDVVVSRVWSVSLRGDYTAVRHTHPLVTDAGPILAVFGDLLDVNLALVYRF